MSDIQTAVDFIQNGMKQLRAFKNAEAALNVLLNLEQVGRELDAANAAKRADLEKANADLIAARETAATLEAHAGALVAEANEKSEAARKAADLYVTRTQSEADAAAGAAREALAARQAEIAAADEILAAKRDELAAIETKISAAREAAKKLLEG